MEMPSPDEIVQFYQGFSFQTHISKLDLILTPETKQWMASFVKPSSRMLDIGGGGGFFAKAFEEFGFGEAVVLDLDHEACEFAKNELGLTNVIEAPVESLSEKDIGTFNFIYCRHVIEHLVDPASFIQSCYKLLKKGGTFIVQCPNGSSKEQAYLYPERWKIYLVKIKVENEWGKFKSIRYSLTHRYGFGLDPLRHLWAISPKGLMCVCDSLPGSSYSVETAALTDQVYSPYYSSKSKIGRLRDRIDHVLVPSLLDGCHLIAKITRN